MATDAVVGGLLGQAVGDMLGFPVERRGPAECVAFAAAWLAGAGPAPGRDGHPMGQVSDDTQCTLALMRAGPGDLVAEARELVAALPTIVGAERNTRAMLRALAREPRFADGTAEGFAAAVAARDAAVPPGPPTNGAAMRAWAQGVPRRSGQERDAAVRASAALTHAAPASAGAAVEVAELAAQLVAGVDPRNAPTLAALMLRGRGVAPVAIEAGLALAELPDEGARASVGASHGAPPWDAVSPHAVATVAWAVRSFALGGGDFRRVALGAMSGGGDVDTVAGIAGAWCGLVSGEAGLPAHLVALARDGDRCDVAGMRSAARGYATACGAWDGR